MFERFLAKFEYVSYSTITVNNPSTKCIAGLSVVPMGTVDGPRRRKSGTET